MASKYIVSSKSTWTSKKTGLPFTSTAYFNHWIMSRGFGAGMESSPEKAARLNYREALYVARRLGARAEIIKVEA